jgi:phosphatidylinositol-binding clathrin assembly protein
MNSVNNADKRKTIMGRKLRIMTVEKGLLRETKVVQKMINALVECRVHIYLRLFANCHFNSF